MLSIYNKVRTVPAEAQKPIKGGRLKGMTDINPMWRIKTLTEQFGPVGQGWYYEILEKRIEEGANNEKVAFVDINLFVKFDGEWSKPIQGTGGSSFVAKEKSGLYTSDECFKMALTDAISVSCKALGIGADVYWNSDRSKYSNPYINDTKPPTPKQSKTSTKPATQIESATDGQIRAIYGICKKNNINNEDEVKAWISSKLKRKISSMRDMSKAEASNIITALNQLA